MEDLELEELAKSTTSTKSRQVLDEVARLRSSEDERLGYFRDYPDHDSQSLALWHSAATVEANAIARGPKRPWLAQLAVTFGALVFCLQPQVPVEERERRLRAALLAMTAVAVAWIEALDGRADGRPVAPKLKWWRRAWNWLRGAA